MPRSKKEYDRYRPMSKGKYLVMGKQDIGKRSIRPKDRCDCFNKIWHETYIDVMKYWEKGED